MDLTCAATYTLELRNDIVVLYSSLQNDRAGACLSLEVLIDTADMESASWEFAVCIEIIHMSMYIV